MKELVEHDREDSAADAAASKGDAHRNAALAMEVVGDDCGCRDEAHAHPEAHPDALREEDLARQKHKMASSSDGRSAYLVELVRLGQTHHEDAEHGQ